MHVDIIDKKNGSRREIEDGQLISLDRPSVVRLKLAPESVARYVRRGDDLVLVLKDGQEIVILSFFVKYPNSDASDEVATSGEAVINEEEARNDLILEDDYGVVWWGQYPEEWSEFHFTEIELDHVTGLVWWPWVLGLVAGGTAIAAATSGGGSKGKPPVAADDTSRGMEDGGPVTGNALTNDSDPDNDSLVVTGFVINGTNYTPGTDVTISGVGVFKLAADGSYSFTPAVNWNGVVPTITYTVSDGKGGSDTANLVITIDPVNDAPEAVGVIGPQNDADAETITSLDVSSFFADVDGDVLTYSARGLPQGLSIDPATGVISGTIDPSASQSFPGGVHSVTITASDGNGGTVDQTFEWTVSNPSPTANDDFATTDEDTPVSGNVLTGAGAGDVSDSDPDGDVLSIESFVIAGVSGIHDAGDTVQITGVGTFTLSADGAYSFTPAVNWNGVVPTITYTVSDGEGGSNTADLVITVNPVIDLVAADDSVTTDEDTPVNGTVAGNDSTTSGGTLEYVKATDPSNGTVVVNIDGTYTYTPNANFNGTDSFTYTVTDPASGESLTQTVEITVNPVADLVAADDSVTTDEDTPVNGTVAGNDSTTSGGTLEYVKATDPSNGTVVVNIDGTYTYTPNANFNGTDSFTYTVTDPASGESLTQTVEITVNPVADLVAADDSVTTDEDTPVNGTVAGNDSTTSGGTLEYVKATDPSNGTVVVNIDGTYTYTPNANFNGTDSFTYTVTDPASGETLTQTVEITVNPVADLVAADDSVTTDEDTPVNGTVAGNDSTTSGGTLEYVKATDPSNGTVVVNIDGTYTYTPNANFNGTDSFTYTVTDPASGESLTQTVEITVNPVADLVAADDSVTTDEDTPVNGTVAGNDSTTSGGTLEYVKATDPSNGTVVVNIDGTYTYTPNANFNGTDSFTYTVTDPASGESLTQTVEITVNPVADLVAADDSVTTDEDTPVNGTVAGNDSTTSGGTLEYVKATDPSNGTVVVNIDGTYTYTPNANFNGTDSFTYTVTDPASGESLTQTVEITVNPVADLVAADDSVTTDEDTPVNGTVAGNDSTTSGGTLEYVKATDPSNGTVVVNIDGTYTYTPNANFNGTDSFTYTVTDPASGESLTQTVEITVNPVADLVAADDSVTTDEDTPVNGTVAGNDSTTSGGTLEYVKATDPSNGTVVVNIDGTYTYTPNANFNGTDSFTYTVTDPASGESLTQTVEITVNPVADLVAADDSVTTDEDTPVNGTVAGNDSTTSGGTLEYVKATDPSNGTVVVNIDGTYTYTPNANFNGTDSFTYTVTDPASGETLTQTVEITVNPVADLVAADDSVTTDEDTPVNGTVAGNDSTTSGGTLEYVKATDPSNGTVVVNIDGTYTYTPNANFNGTDSFTYTVTDPASGETLTQTVEITVNPVADLVAADDSVTTDEDTPVNGTVAGNDSTTSGGTLEYVKATDPSNGTVVVNIDGTYTYTPNANFNGTDSFTYTVTDPASGESLTQTVEITVNPVADLVAADDSVTTDEDTPVNGTVAGNDSTTSGGTLEYVKATDPSNGTVVVNIDGTYTYTPNANFNGTDSFTYTVTDPASGESLTQTVEITVNPVADLVAADDSVTTDEDTPVNGTVAGNDSTTSGGTLEYVKATDPSNGTVVVNIDGTYTYTPNANFNGTDSFTYTVTDPASGESLTQTVEITVNPVADLVAADDSVTTDEDTPVNGTVAGNDSTTSGGTLEYVKATDPSNGTVVVNIDGTYTYRPNANFNGTDSFTYTVTDPASGESLTQTVEITVNPVADLVAADDSVTTDEDTPVNGTVAGNDSTTSGGTLEYVKATDPSNGTVVVNIDGTYTYTPNANFNGTDSFTYTVTDPASGESLTQTVEITVNPVADLVAADDSVTTDEDTPVNGTVAGNDSTTSGGTLEYVKATDPSNGTVVVNIDGTYTYTPNANFNGTDSFTYTVTDPASGETLTQTVEITVNPVADLVAADDSVTTDEDTPVNGTVAGNDSTTSGGTLEYVKATDPSNGTVVVNIDGTYTYTPNANFNGTDSFTYTVTDPASGESLTQTVEITVNPVADLVAADDSVTTDEDTPVNGTVAGNDSTTSGGTLEYVKATDPSNGTVVVNIDGTYTYTPNANFNGTDSFTYTVTDPASGESLTQTVEITVNPVADLVAADDSVTTDEDTPVNGTVAGNDSTTSGGTLEYVKATDPSNGTVVVNIDGTYTYTPNANFNGTDSFTYTVTDPASGETLTQTVEITVNPVADLVAADDSVTTDEDTPVNGTVAGNDSTTSGGTLEYVKATDPSNGTVVVNIDGTYTYTPNANFNGTDSFTYTVTDPASGESLTQTVEITVNPVADLVAADDSVTTDEDTPVNGTVAGNDSTTSGGTLEYVKATDPSNGTVVVNIDGTYTYTPNANFNGTDSFTYTVTDPASGETLTQTVEITVNPVADLVAADDSVTTDEDTPVNGTVAGNDSTTSGGTLEYVKATDPSNGTVVVNIDGTYTYTPNANFNGTDSFTYTVTDPASGESLTQTVEITVNPVADLVAADDSVTTDEDTPVNGTVAGNDSTTSGGTLEYVKATDPSNGTVVVNIDGTYTYTPNANFNGTDSFTYTVTDPASGESLTQTVEITVNPVNDAPVISGGDQQGTVVEAGNLADGTPTTGTPDASGSFSATDVENDPLVWSVVGTPDTTYGVFSINPTTGAWTYVLDNSLPATQALNEGDEIPLTYTVQVSDGQGGTETREVVITVNGTNDSPVAVADVNTVTEAGVLDGGNSATVGVPTAEGDVLANDSDVDDGETDTLQVSGVNFGAVVGSVGVALSGTYGSLVLAADGTYVYTLDNDNTDTQALGQGQTATEIFTYTVTDVNGATHASTLTITVQGTNDQPVITSDASDATGFVVEAGTGVVGTDTASGTVTASDVDTGASLEWSVADTDGIYGTIVIDPVTGEWTYTLDNSRAETQALNNDENVIDEFTAIVTDEHGATRQQIIRINVVGSNDDLIGTNAAANVVLLEDTSATGTLQDYVYDVDDIIELISFQIDADGDGAPETYTSGNYVWGDDIELTDSDGVALGTLTIDSDGSYVFTPAPNYSGAVPTMTYTMAEATGGSATPVTQTITFEITPVADAPDLDPDKTVDVREDTAQPLNLTAPAITDLGTGVANGDYPERLGEITLTFDGAGAAGATLVTGSTVLTPVGGVVTIVLTDVGHATTVPAEDVANGIYYLTSAQYEALEVVPPAESGMNFDITVEVTSYEVDASGAVATDGQGDPIPGATNTQLITVDVQAVTDGANLTINGGSSANLTGIEDQPITISGLLAALNDSDGNAGSDDDGSERFQYVVSGLPVGSIVTIDGVETTISAGVTSASSAFTTSHTPPVITITPPADLSGDIEGVTVTLNSLDTDEDSSGAIDVVGSSVTLNLYVTPVAGDIGASDLTTDEDMPVAFLSGVRVTDTIADGGSEVINSVTFEVPTGWVVTQPAASAGWAYNLVGNDAEIIFDNSLTQAQRETILGGFTIKPPAHSSADVTIDLSITSTDSNTVNGAQVNSGPVTVTRSVDITVDPVAERTDTDSDGVGGNDVTIMPGRTYAVPGSEDVWFALGATYTGASNTTGGFDLLAGWSNADSDEFIYAVLTPTLDPDTAGETETGTQFRYSTDGGATWVTQTYVGEPLWVPQPYLDTLQVMLPPDVSGTLTIGVQAGTVDYDDDADVATIPLDPPQESGDGVSVDVGGSATLSLIRFDPVADAVTMALNGRATGLEDTAIPLSIKTTSSDPSETFTVTISGIPVGATITYGVGPTAVTFTASAGNTSYEISDFSNTVPVSITPPLNSNGDFQLTVSAVSVDGSVQSAPVSRTIDVSVTGVADTATVTLPVIDFTTTEAVLDNGINRVSLDQLIDSVQSFDSDGSEAVTLRITGVPEEFSIVGAIMVTMGTGGDRVWVVSADNLANVSIVTPPNYSGTVNFKVAPVTTENDGDSRTGGLVDISFTVTPSPEATITPSATLVEDEVMSLNIAIVHQNGDNDEALGRIYISQDYALGADYTLYLGGVALDQAGLNTTVIGGETYFIVEAEQIGDLGAQGASNLDGDLGSLEFLYEVIDPSSDGSLTAVTELKPGSLALSATPVTDPIDVSINNIVMVSATGTVTDNSAGDDATPDTAVVTEQGALTVTMHVNSQDTDGSEHLVRILITGVPDGVTVTGASQVGANSWLLIYDAGDARTIGASGIDVPVEFIVGIGAGNGLSTISMTALVQDQGQSASTPAGIVTDSVEWTLDVALSDGGVYLPPAIDQWEYNNSAGTEDSAFVLGDVMDAAVSVADPGLAYSYTVSVTDLPPGSQVSGMILTNIGGVPTWTATVTVPAGGDSQAALDSLLAGISITPPQDSNDNNASFAFDARLMGSVVGGPSIEADERADMPVTPVTDEAVITVSAGDTDEGGTSVNATIAVYDPADGVHGQVFDGKLYVQVSTTNNDGGNVTDSSGQPIVLSTVSGVDGVPDGDYYVIDVGTAGGSVDLTYTVPDGVTLQPGAVTFTAYAQTQETGANNVASATAANSAVIEMVNNGVTVNSQIITGAEPLSADKSHAIELVGLSIALNDNNESESIHSILLAGVPVGFLLYVGSSAGDATPAAQASNAGGDGVTNTWVLSADGSMPAYVAILPAPNWSGTLDNLALVVESGEASLSGTRVDTVPLETLTVEAVANGVTIDPTLSFGREGQIISLNLNASMADAAAAKAAVADESTETTTLQITGLGEYAAFYVGDTLYNAFTYDTLTDTYTITGLSQDDLDDLGFVQAAAALTDMDTNTSGVQVTVNAFTVESSNGAQSEPLDIPKTLTIALSSAQGTTGNDRFIWDGEAINGRAGTDTVELRLGESLTRSDLVTYLRNVEALDLSTPGANRITGGLSISDVLSITGSNNGRLTIHGDDEDEVSLSNTDEWSTDGQVQNGYIIYTSTSTGVSVAIDEDIHVSYAA